MSLLLKALRDNNDTHEVPVGSSIYNPQGELLITKFNLSEKNVDPTQHAEILAIKEAAKLNSHTNLNQYSLYVTLEPCFMCLGAILNANINKVVFGAFSDSNKSNPLLLDSFRQSFPKIEFVGGVLEKECQELLTNWFKSIRP